MLVTMSARSLCLTFHSPNQRIQPRDGKEEKPRKGLFLCADKYSMADRFPLIINSTSSKIEEIPSGDNLNLSNNNIVNAGNITAVNTTSTSTVLLTGLSTDPPGVAGLMYYNTTTGKFRGYNGISNTWGDLN